MALTVTILFGLAMFFESKRLGTQIEAGLGFDMAVDSRLNLYGDVNWQQRLSKIGATGISLNGSFRVSF